MGEQISYDGSMLRTETSFYHYTQEISSRIYNHRAFIANLSDTMVIDIAPTIVSHAMCLLTPVHLVRFRR
jgi:hypothetical protein